MNVTEDRIVNDPALVVQAVEEVRENRAGLEIGGGREILGRDIRGLAEALQELAARSMASRPGRSSATPTPTIFSTSSSPARTPEIASAGAGRTLAGRVSTLLIRLTRLSQLLVTVIWLPPFGVAANTIRLMLTGIPR